MLKRLFSAVLVLVLTLTAFSGCADSETIIEGSTFEEVGGDVIVGDTITSASTDKTTSVNKQERPDKVGDVEYSFDIADIEMPARKLKNKTITYYGWAKPSTDKNSTATLLKKEFGIKIVPVIVSQDGYWDTLATYIASGKSPDIVETTSWDYYPAPIALGLLQPLDDILDLEDELWEDVYAFNNEIAWNGKHYFVYNDAPISAWIYYNKKMFKNFGVDKTPKDYFREDNWTWDTLAEIAKKFVTFNADGSLKTSGFTMGFEELVYTTGVDLVSRENNKWKLNLDHPNITKLMNWVYANGKAGTNALSFIGDRTTAFANGEVAMMSYDYYTITDERLKGIRSDIEWVPMPRMDKSSDYYMGVWTMPNPCIPVGAKNVEGAALYIEFNKWKQLGWRSSPFLASRTNAAHKKYKIKDTSLASQITEEERKWTEEILAAHEYKYITRIWSSWVYEAGDLVYPGVNEVLGGKPWSSVYNQVKPKYEAVVNKYNK